MRKIVNSTYITLDGVIQNPQDWPALGSFTDAGYTVQNELLQQCDAVVMGRHTYESFASVWSTMSGDPFSDRMNALPKHVVSTALRDPQWHNTTVIERDPVEAVRRLKEEPGGDIVQYGFGPLARALLAEDLLDELRLWVHPFLLGTGTTDDLLYRPGTAGSFTLTESVSLPGGVVILTLAAKPEGAAQ
jgi:dihydrofolate reductase